MTFHPYNLQAIEAALELLAEYNSLDETALSLLHRMAYIFELPESEIDRLITTYFV
ncbi:MAG: hypothetical protein SNJ58_03560 [Aggregatilineales bacterium]